nr:unnamed protein product [Callosobruchus chinensis]
MSNKVIHFEKKFSRAPLLGFIPRKLSRECPKRSETVIAQIWARAHQDGLLPQRRNVFFSDESRFGLVSDYYRERVWRQKGGQID